MSRSGYFEDCEMNWSWICWRGAVASAIRGKRGQLLLTELLNGLDKLPNKRLIDGDLEISGEFCALGVVGWNRGLNMEDIDPEDSEVVAKKFNIANALAKEIVWENDQGAWSTETPEDRWLRMRSWVDSKIIPNNIS